MSLNPRSARSASTEPRQDTSKGDMSRDADVTVWRLSQGDFELTSRDIG